MMNNSKQKLSSYPKEDVTFLLSPEQIDYVSVDQKEQLIQSGEMHYSEMLSKELPPSEQHLTLYRQSMRLFGQRVATEVLALAKGLIEHIPTHPIILVSLVRAGVPLAVCLLHALKDLGVSAKHYGVSIIRDKGIDYMAMQLILQQHHPDSIVFIDGWTGKGAIAQELTQSLQQYSLNIQPRLVVLADPCGKAWLSSSQDDWLIPFGILGAPIAGLISRSLWKKDGLHSIMLCEHLKSYDVSHQFVRDIDMLRHQLSIETIPPARPDTPQEKQRRQQLSNYVIAHLANRYNVDTINRIKPGIAEATRAVMRRVPEHILVNNLKDPDISLLIHLAEKANINIQEIHQGAGIYRAITIIKKVI